MGTGKIPMRMCIGCRDMKPKRELIRIVKTPDGEIKPDATGRLNGRGAYICRSVECFKKARRSGALQRAFGESVPDSVYEAIKTELDGIEK